MFRGNFAMSRGNFDAIVVGLGGVGSAALYHLARRGVRALGLEGFKLGHDRGSSHGHTRIIRQAYYEHPDYVPLLMRAYQRWQELGDACGESLFRRLGLLEVGRPDGQLVRGVLESADRHALTVDRLLPGEIESRFPGTKVDPGDVGVFEPNAGCLFVERCVLAHLQLAETLGATIQPESPVVDWSADGAGVTVRTESDSYMAERLIIAAGAWSGKLLPTLGVHLEVRRKVQFWYADSPACYAADAHFPAFLFETSAGEFYGIPAIDNRGLKMAEHTGGEPVPDPSTVRRAVDDRDVERVAEFASLHLPQVGHSPTASEVCMYTVSPDRHFIVDRHPERSRVVFAAGLSGHGFKFTGVLGEALADLAMDGRTDLPIGFLGLDRPTLRTSL